MTAFSLLVYGFLQALGQPFSDMATEKLAMFIFSNSAQKELTISMKRLVYHLASNVVYSKKICSGSEA